MAIYKCGQRVTKILHGGGESGVLPYLGIIGMCCFKGYDFPKGKQFSLGWGIQIREFKPRIGYHFPGN